MTDPGPARPAFYRPAEVAAMLRCSEWWVKEQARRRRIPYAWIGSSYLFTTEHIAEIVRLFEVRPTDGTAGRPSANGCRTPGGDAASDRPIALVARVPRRMRQADSSTRPAA